MARKEQARPSEIGARMYQEWREKLAEDPEFQTAYEEAAAEGELWLQLAEARRESGLTQEQLAERLGVSQAQVARVEKRGYDAHSLNTLRRYVQALGPGFSIEVIVHTPKGNAEKSRPNARPDRRPVKAAT